MVITRHFTRRKSQRGVKQAAVDAALCYGRVMYRHGALYHILGRREVRRLPHLAPYVNTIVVISHGDVLLTTFRNARLPRRERRTPWKRKSRRRSHRAWAGERKKQAALRQPAQFTR